MEFVRQFLTPLIKILFIGGFIGFGLFYLIKAFHNAWSKEWKFIWKYSIKRRSYPETTLSWCMEGAEKGLGWYDIKKLLMVKGMRTDVMNETLWIYDKVISELNKSKGGVKNGRKFEGSDSKNEKQSRELPNF